MIEYFRNFDFQQAGIWQHANSGAHSSAYHINCEYTILSLGTAALLPKLLHVLATNDIMLDKISKPYIHGLRQANGKYYFLLTRLQTGGLRKPSDIAEQMDIIESYISRYYYIDSFADDLHNGNFGKLCNHTFVFDGFKPRGMLYQTHKFQAQNEAKLLCAEYRIEAIGL